MNWISNFIDRIDAINDFIGRAVSWLTLYMVVMTFVIVVLRYIFQLGWVWLQESVMYAHALVFLLCAGYGLLRDVHVRIDVMVQNSSNRLKAVLSIVGIVCFLFPMCGVIFWVSWPFVIDAWSIWEGSKNVGGIEGVYFLKTLILVFSLLLFLQGFSLLGKNILTLKGHEHG
jgi:TRAP-type mannitol/chloroaromatic compound transport system permease small subunit